MMKILKCEPLNRGYTVFPGDTFTLLINGKIVHCTEITQADRLTHWALVEVFGGLGYFIGDDTLPDELKKLAKAGGNT